MQANRRVALALRFSIAFALSLLASCSQPESEQLCTPSQRSAGTGTISANPNTVTQGQSTTLHWSVSVASTCWNDINVNGQPVDDNGSWTIAPWSTVTYNLKLGARTLSSVTVHVEVPTAPT